MSSNSQILLSSSNPYLSISLQEFALDEDTRNKEHFKMVDKMYIYFPYLEKYVLILSFSSWDSCANKYKIREHTSSLYLFSINRKFGMQSILYLIYRQ